MIDSNEALPEPPNISELLNDLFLNHRHPSGREFNNREVADGITKVAGKKLIDESTISRMRAGIMKKPSMDAVEALCMFFPVEPAYFYPRLAALKIRQSGRSPADQVKVALRATSLDPTVQEHVTGIVRALTAHEQTRDSDDSEDPEQSENKEITE